MSRLLAVDPNVVPGKARELLEGGVAQQGGRRGRGLRAGPAVRRGVVII